MKHTPAPWHVGMKPGPMIYGPSGEQVADLSARMVPDSETLGNLALITAAPEMLQLLRKIHTNAAESPEWIRERINNLFPDLTA